MFMVLTCPLAYPISLILDKILGEEMGTVYNKKRLIELLKVTRETNDLEKEEVDIVTGALVYKEKTVRSVILGNQLICGQSYKHFMLVNYDSRVVLIRKFPKLRP